MFYKGLTGRQAHKHHRQFKFHKGQTGRQINITDRSCFIRDRHRQADITDRSRFIRNRQTDKHHRQVVFQRDRQTDKHHRQVAFYKGQTGRQTDKHLWQVVFPKGQAYITDRICIYYEVVLEFYPKLHRCQKSKHSFCIVVLVRSFQSIGKWCKTYLLPYIKWTGWGSYLYMLWSVYIYNLSTNCS